MVLKKPHQALSIIPLSELMLKICKIALSLIWERGFKEAIPVACSGFFVPHITVGSALRWSTCYPVSSPMIATYTHSSKNVYDVFLTDHHSRVGPLSKQFEVVLKPLVQLICLSPSSYRGCRDTTVLYYAYQIQLRKRNQNLYTKWDKTSIFLSAKLRPGQITLMESTRDKSD